MVVRFSAAFAAIASSVLAFGCSDNNENEIVGGQIPAEVTTTFTRTDIVTNATDPDLINPWGIVSEGGLFWIADNGTGVVSVFDATGRPVAEGPSGKFSVGAGITGIASLSHTPGTATTGAETSPFVMNIAEPSCAEPQLVPAALVLANMNGTLIAIGPEAPARGTTVVDLSGEGASFFGVTRVDTANGPVLLAADFANARIDVFDTNFQRLTPAAGAFVDPNLPAGFAPWNVLELNGLVFVAFAKQGVENRTEEQHGAGLGHVTIFDTNGAVVGRLSSELLNAPWGMAVARGQANVDCDHDGDHDSDDTCISQVDCNNNGTIDADDTCTAQIDCNNDGVINANDTCITTRAGTIFIGNFGDGTITTFDPTTFQATGQLVGTDSRTIVIPGLWGITFENATVDQAGNEIVNNPGSLFFVAGGAEETSGVFGRLDPVVTTTRPAVVVTDTDDQTGDIDDQSGQ